MLVFSSSSSFFGGGGDCVLAGAINHKNERGLAQNLPVPTDLPTGKCVRTYHKLLHPFVVVEML